MIDILWSMIWIFWIIFSSIDSLWNLIWIFWMILIVTAYGLTQTWRITPSDIEFTHINLLWSIFLLLSLLVHFNLSSFVLEIVWIWISIYWYISYFKKKKFNIKYKKHEKK